MATGTLQETGTTINADSATQASGATRGGSLLPGAPEGFIPPPVHPAGTILETRRLAEGVYALLSNNGVVDNSGFVVGERGVLVIDAHINAEMAQQIIDAVRRVTEKPILYLVNTNFHGDHTFGNYQFPASTTIVAHRNTAERMTQFSHEKQFMLALVQGDPSVFGDAQLRLPDMTFERYLRIDLGGRAVELHYFGKGNTAGDVVVYQPDAKVAWTGNLIVGAGTIPLMIEYGGATYLGTVARMRAALDITTIVPGHAPMTDGTILTRYLRYISELIDAVRGAMREGKTRERLLAETTLGEAYLPPTQSPLVPLLQGFHRLNVVRTFEELSQR